jgi:hypothetical protein
MKFVLGVITGVLIGCLVLGSVFLAIRSTGPFQAAQARPASTHTAAKTSRPTSTPSRTAPSPASSIPSPAAPTASRTAINQGVVTFDLAITGVSGSGFTRLVSAAMTNTGSAVAHHVSIKVEAFCQGSRIKLGGKDAYQQELGSLAAGESLNVEAELSLNLADGARVLKNGADLAITIVSDEKTQSQKYTVNP